MDNQNQSILDKEDLTLNSNGTEGGNASPEGDTNPEGGSSTPEDGGKQPKSREHALAMKLEDRQKEIDRLKGELDKAKQEPKTLEERLKTLEQELTASKRDFELSNKKQGIIDRAIKEGLDPNKLGTFKKYFLNDNLVEGNPEEVLSQLKTEASFLFEIPEKGSFQTKSNSNGTVPSVADMSYAEFAKLI